MITVDDGDATYAETGTGWAAGSLAGGQGGDYRTLAKPASTATFGEQIIDNSNTSKYSETGSSWVTGGLAGGYQSNYRAIAPVGTSAGNYEVIQDENQATFTGPWGNGALTGGYSGDYLWCDPTGPSGSATYTFSNVPAGNYEIYAWWVPHPNRSAASPFTISVLDNNDAVVETRIGTMPQNSGGLSWTKINLTSLSVAAGQSVRIRLDSTSSGYVIADGIKLAGTRTTQPGTATWNFSGLAAGTYEVSTTWSSHSNRASNAPFTVTTAAETTTASIDQRIAPSGISAAGTTWKSLGQVIVSVNGSINVSTTNTGANGYVIADAIRVVGLSPTGTATWMIGGLAPGNYEAYASWVPYANRATNATYQMTLLDSSTSSVIRNNSTSVNQRNAPEEGGWSRLFDFDVTNVSTADVVIAVNNAGADGFVIADAIMLKPKNDPPKFYLNPARKELEVSWYQVAIGPDRKGSGGTNVSRYIFQAYATDPENGTVGYFPVPGESSVNAWNLFEIDQSTGVISLKPDAVLPVGTTRYTLKLRAQDPDGNSSKGTVEVKVKDTAVGITGDSQSIEGTTDQIRLTFNRIQRDPTTQTKEELTVQYRFRWGQAYRQPVGPYLDAQDFNGVAAPNATGDHEGFTTGTVVIPAGASSVDLNLTASTNTGDSPVETVLFEVLEGIGYAPVANNGQVDQKIYKGELEARGIVNLQILDGVTLWGRTRAPMDDVNDVELNDALQGGIGDCYLWAAVANFINRPPMGMNFKDLITPLGGADYRINLKPTAVTISFELTRGFFAARLSGDSHEGKAEIWPQVLELGYFKALQDEGINPDGGSAIDAWYRLTGLKLPAAQAELPIGAGALNTEVAVYNRITTLLAGDFNVVLNLKPKTGADAGHAVTVISAASGKIEFYDPLQGIIEPQPLNLIHFLNDYSSIAVLPRS